MRHRDCTLKDMIVSGMAAALAIIVVFTPLTVQSGGYTTGPKDYSGPRWSNDRHHEDSLIVGRDCVALPPGVSAEYIPGRDAWGRTIIPAEQPKGLNNSYPLEVGLEILLNQKNIGGKNIDLTASALPLIEQTLRLRDCQPSIK